MPKISALPPGTQLASADAFPFLSRLSNVTERVSLDTLQSTIANSPQVSQLISAGAQPLSIVVNVKDPRFGAVGNGVHDDTAAITAAFTYAQAQAFAGIFPTNSPIVSAVLYFPPGDYVFNGPSFNYTSNSAIYFTGAGRQQTRIQIAAGIYLVDTDKLIYSTDVRGIHFNGGKGVLRYSGTATNVQGTHVVEDCYFGNYTECAIGNDATDMPYWKIHRNIFLGTITSKGVCLSGLTDQSTIEDNEFQYNLIHIEIGTNGTTPMIRNNDFIRGFASVGTPIIDIWLVPGSQLVGLVGAQIINNRMGNENLDATDYRILIADEDTATGTDHITYKPKLSASTQWAGAVKVKDNRVGGIASARALITSWTKNLDGLEVRNDFYGTPIQSLVFGAGVNVPGGTQNSLLNSFEASSIAGGAADLLLPEPVVPFSGVFDDPNALYQGYSSVHSYWGSGSDPSYLDLTSTLLSAFVVGSGSGAVVADAIGGNTAVEFTATASGFLAFGQFLPATANRIAFIEFDLKQGSSLPLPVLDFRVTNNANSNDIACRRLISIPPYWKRIRIPFSLPSLTSTYNLATLQITGFSAGVATKFQIGRFRVYHAHEPIHPGATYLEASTPYKPPILGSNMGTTAIVALIGAMPLDYATAAFSLDLQNLQITAAAGSNAVNVRFQNGIGPSVNLGSGTLACRVFKFLQNG